MKCQLIKLKYLAQVTQAIAKPNTCARRDSIQMVINSRYNKLIVGWITNLTGGDLDNFTREYRPSDQFILSASDYKFMLHIVNSFTDYQKKQGLEVDLDEILRKVNIKY